MFDYKKVFLVVAGSLVALPFLYGSANGQFTTRVLIADRAKNRPVARQPSGGRRNTGVRRVETKVITKVERVRVSNLTVATEKGAKVTLTLKGPRPTSVEKIADARGSAIFDDIKPGTYKVTAEKDDFETAEAESVVISAQKAHGLDMDLKPVTYKLKIKTNLNGGEIRFTPAIYKGKDPATGNVLSEKLGNYCVVEIARNGEALISELKKGYYDIDIRPEAIEFENATLGINVPENIDENDADSAGEVTTFDLDLEKKISTATFTTSWISADWLMPANWALDRRLRVRSNGIALPRSEQYRNYVNFEMIANVKLPDEATAGFVLRAEDEKNYYLLQLSGSKAQNPYTATLSAVKNGVPQFINSATTVAFAKTLAADSGFRVFVKGEQSGFTVQIEDSTTGRTHGVGQLLDPYKTFQKGAVGIAGTLNSSFEVNYFEVCTPVCAR